MEQKELEYEQADNLNGVSKNYTIDGKQKMTVREISEATGAPVRTIHDIIDRLYPGLKVNGVTTYLDKVQVSAVSSELKKAHNVDLADTRKVATTDLEMMEQGARFAAWALAKLKEQEAELAIAKPKAEVYEQISDASGLKSLQEVAKILGYGPKQFFKKLRDEHILYMDNGVNLPYQEFIDNGIFVVREEPYVAGGESRVYSRIFVTGKGELWLTRKIGREV